MDPLKVLWVLTNSTYLVSKYMRGNSNKDEDSPLFDLLEYEAEVEEDVPVHYTVVRVTATNHESLPGIKYEITGGNVGDSFSVNANTGDIFVYNPLDYETKQKYELTYSATVKDTSTITNVLIRVKDVNDNPPVFSKTGYTTELTEEEDRNLPKKILQVDATDADTFQPLKIIYFLSGQGIDSDDPETGYFAIDQHSGEIFVLKALDRDPPVGRPQWKFTVFAQDEGGKGLVGFADVHVNLKDINDNLPQFIEQEYIGNVTENGPKGLLVLTMSAEDHDDPNENGNAKVKYSIEKNAIEESSGLPIFEIHPNSGEIRTLMCCLDRERTADYSIQVIATDGAGLKGTGTVTIRVLDMNDSAPVFTKEEWLTEVEETVDDVIPDTPVLTVAVRDSDENNRFVYSVVEKSGYGADRFRMVTNLDGTGSLVVAKPLNYEDPLQRNGFRFQIQVLDEDEEGSSEVNHVSYSWVVVKLLDVNDNAPQFENPQPTVTVYEDVPVGQVLEQVRVKDLDSGGRSKVHFVIDRASDRGRHFFISQDGKISVHRSLDRETYPVHLLTVMAVDDGYPPQTGSVTVTIVVGDVNDNPPRFKDDYRPVVTENGTPGEILKIYAEDPDDTIKGNGPPYNFTLDSEADDKIKSSFRVEQREGEEFSARVVSLISFDREAQKEYLLPIIIRDSGQPEKTSTNTLTVVIGDVNDNPMAPGKMDVLAYVYRAQNLDTPIGRVFVNDLDDWDLGDKEFRWESREHPRFSLDKATGELSMRAGTPRGLYDLYFKVQDRRHDQTNVGAHVRVRVRDMSYNSITNSGSLRLSGISAVDLVKNINGKSKLEVLQKTLAEVLEVERDHVTIFSVQQVISHPPLTDIRFAVTNIRKEVIDGLLMLHTKKVEQAVEVNISVVGVDACLEERQHCEGSCTSRLEVGGVPSVVNGNTTTLVGVRVAVMAECVCGSLDYSRPESCRTRPCYNGGRCVEGKYGISCSCPSGFKGPRCQKTSRSFKGDGWAWYPPLQMCESSHLSLDFLARKAEGQLLYNGPVGPPKPGGSTISDFISLELVDGYPRLLMDYGSGTLELTIATENRLNDSSWHRLDVIWNAEEVELVVDSCQGVGGPSPITSCRAQGSMPPFREQLNLNTPLQLGGRHTNDFSPTLYRWTAVPHGIPFDGCIKNLFYNSKMYDLAGSGLSRGGALDCPGACLPSETGVRCEEHGECVGSPREPRCVCHPGYHGPQCSLATTPVTLQPHSYVKYSLNLEPDHYNTVIQLRFRTREEGGELFRLGDQRSSQFAILEIVDSRLRFRYRLSGGVKSDLRIDSVRINDGHWHQVRLWRVGSSVSLELDGGEGRRGNRTLDFRKPRQLSVDSEEGVYLGGKPEYTEIGIIAVDQDYQEGCIDDVRLNGRPLPLPPVSNSTAWAQVMVGQNLQAGCPTDRMCSDRLCQGSQECADPWNTHRCFCGEGRVLTPDGKLCVHIDDCFVQPCVNGGLCLEMESRQLYRCVCPTGFWGERCELSQTRQTLRFSLGAFVTVLGCILAILMIVLLVLVMYNRCRESTDQKDLECDVRENIIKYNDDGGGLDDMTAVTVTMSGLGEMSSHTLANDTVSETSFIDLTKKGISQDQIEMVQFLPCVDEVHIYTFEGGGSSRASLSSLSIAE